MKGLKQEFDKHDKRRKLYKVNKRGKEKVHEEKETRRISVKQDLLRRLSEMPVQVLDYKIPEYFTKCHAKDSVILLVEGKEIYASKQILRIASPVFKSMFDSEFREKTMDTIELPGKTCPEIVLLLSCLYPNMVQQITEDTVTTDKVNISLQRHERTEMVGIGGLLKKCIKIDPWFKPAEALLPVFGKLNVSQIGVNMKTGHGKIRFDDYDSAAVACSMNGEMIDGVWVNIGIDEFDIDYESGDVSYWERPELHRTESEKLQILLRLADEYQIEYVSRLCEEKYICKFMGHEKSYGDTIKMVTLVKLLDIAEKYHFSRLLELVCQKAKETDVKKLEAEPGFWQLSINLRYKIYSSKFEKFEKFMNWKAFNRYRNLNNRDMEKEKKPYFPKDVQHDPLNDEPFRKCDRYMSFKIQVGGANFYASKEVLAMSSDVFKNRIEQLNDSEILDFPNENTEDFMCLLRGIHPNFVSGVTGSNVLRILVLSDVYRIRSLAQECDVVLCREFDSLLIKPKDILSKIPSSIHDHIHSKTSLTVCGLVVVAAKHDLPMLQRRCCDYLSKLDYGEVKCIINVENDVIPKSVKLQILSRYLVTAEGCVENYRGGELYRDKERENKTSIHPQEEESFMLKKSVDDVKIITGGKSLYADEDILAIASPELHQRIVTNAENQRCIVLTDSSYEDMEMFLRCIYPNALAEVDDVEVVKLLELSSTFKVTVFCNICEDAFLKLPPEKFTPSMIIDLIRKAEKYNMPRLLEKCQSILESRLGERHHKTHTGDTEIDLLVEMHLMEDTYSSNDYCYYDVSGYGSDDY